MTLYGEDAALAGLQEASDAALERIAPAVSASVQFKKIAWARHDHLYALSTDGVLRLHSYGSWETIITPCSEAVPIPIADFAVHETGDEMNGHERSLVVLLSDGRLFELGREKWQEMDRCTGD